MRKDLKVFQREIDDIFNIVNEYFCSDEIGEKYKQAGQQTTIKQE